MTLKELRLPALLLAGAVLLAAAAPAAVTEKISETYPLAANGTVSLSNVNGSIEIVAWDRNEVALEAEKKAANDEALKRIQIKIESTPERLVIRTEHEKKFKFWDNARASVTYRLKVPAGASLRRVDAVNSSITVTGVKGAVDLDAVNGSITARGLAGTGRFDTVNGSISVTYDSFAGVEKVVLDTVNGSCAITLPKDAAFELNADSVNGRISCDFPITLTKSGRRHLNGKVNGGGAKLVLDSVNGSLSVRSAD